jgi:hypothetical protein
MSRKGRSCAPAGVREVKHFRRVKPKGEITYKISVDNAYPAIYSALTITKHFPVASPGLTSLIRVAKQVVEESLSCVWPTYPRAFLASSNGLSRSSTIG